MRIPFRISFKHNLATHQASHNLILKLTTQDGIRGYGEGVPRDFVTGESIADSCRILRESLIPTLGNIEIEGRDQLWTAIDHLIEDSHRAVAPAACCAMEMALLDCAGKQWQCSIADFLPPAQYQPRYSAVLPMTRLKTFQDLLEMTRGLEIPHIKLKVGGCDDPALIAQVRNTLGADIDIRVDANGAWNAPEALVRIEALLPQGISAVEQPVAKTDFEGLRTVSQALSIPVVADESFCTWKDAVRLAEMDACGMFNIRISKNGGVLAAMRLYDYARRNGIQSQLGCQVGETGLLSATGRHLASAFDFKYLEGAYGPLLLEADIVKEKIIFGKNGYAEPLSGYGLGVTVDEDMVDRYRVDHHSFKVLHNPPVSNE